MAPKKHGIATDIAIEVKRVLAATKVPVYIIIQRLSYMKNVNQSGLIGMTETSNMILWHHREPLLRAARKNDIQIIGATGDQV